jgi:hypothetical protein
MSAETVPSALDALVGLLAERVAVIVVQKLAAGPAAPTYATAKNNPLGSPRAFLDAARAGAFPCHKVGREVRALWADVDAYIRSLPPPARRQKAQGLDAELDAAMAGRRRKRHG